MIQFQRAPPSSFFAAKEVEPNRLVRQHQPDEGNFCLVRAQNVPGTEMSSAKPSPMKFQLSRRGSANPAACAYATLFVMIASAATPLSLNRASQTRRSPPWSLPSDCPSPRRLSRRPRSAKGSPRIRRPASWGTPRKSDQPLRTRAGRIVGTTPRANFCRF